MRIGWQWDHLWREGLYRQIRGFTLLGLSLGLLLPSPRKPDRLLCRRGIIPSLQKAGRLSYDWDQGEEPSLDIDPADFGIDPSARAVPLPAEIGKVDGVGDDNTANDAATVAQAAVHAGTEALLGSPGPTREALIFSVALCLWQVKRYDSVAMAARAAREVIESGRALLRLGRCPGADTT